MFWACRCGLEEHVVIRVLGEDWDFVANFLKHGYVNGVEVEKMKDFFDVRSALELEVQIIGQYIKCHHRRGELRSWLGEHVVYRLLECCGMLRRKMERGWIFSLGESGARIGCIRGGRQQVCRW